MKWMIVADSSCDLHAVDTGTEEIGFETVPFVMSVDSKDYTDDETMNVERFVGIMEKSSSSRSSCPSPAAWEECFLKADRVLAFTISGRLSGSRNSAETARKMVLEKHPEKQIEIIDSLATGPKEILLIQNALNMIREQLSLENVAARCRKLADDIHTLFTLSSFHNLVQNGRVSRVVGFIAGALNIRVIGDGTKEGLIHMKDKARGDIKALRRIVELMAETGFREGPVAVCHCLNEKLAGQLIDMIRARWEGAKVSLYATRGLDSYYAERNGLIISY